MASQRTLVDVIANKAVSSEAVAACTTIQTIEVSAFGVCAAGMLGIVTLVLLNAIRTVASISVETRLAGTDVGPERVLAILIGATIVRSKQTLISVMADLSTSRKTVIASTAERATQIQACCIGVTVVSTQKAFIFVNALLTPSRVPCHALASVSSHSVDTTRLGIALVRASVTFVNVSASETVTRISAVAVARKLARTSRLTACH